MPMYFLIAIWGHERRVYAGDEVLHLHAARRPAHAARDPRPRTSSTAARPGVYTFDYRACSARPCRRPPHLAHARLLRRLRGEAAGRAAPHLAARRPHRGAHRRQRDARRPAHQDRRLRDDPLRGAAVPARRRSRSRRWRWCSAVVGILYGALLAFAQTDLKRLVAYTSVSHMGFVLLGIFAWNALALQGAVLEIVCHAFSHRRPVHHRRPHAGAHPHPRHARTWAACGSWRRAWAAGALLRPGLARACPGLGNFVAEFLILVGTWRVSKPAAVLARRRPGGRHRLLAVDRAARLPGAGDAGRAPCPTSAGRGASCWRYGGAAALARRLPAAASSTPCDPASNALQQHAVRSAPRGARRRPPATSGHRGGARRRRAPRRRSEARRRRHSAALHRAHAVAGDRHGGRHFRRSHALTLGLTLAGLAWTCAMLPLAAARATGR